MTFTQAIKTCFSKYVDFSGRASRAEYWFWQLFVVLCALVVVVLSTVAHGFMVLLLGGLGLILPGLAVAARRLRDGGFSPWLLLIGLIPYLGGIALLVLYCMPSKGVSGVSTYNATVTEATVTNGAQKYCGSCGKLALPGQNYCQGCGAAL